MKIHRAYKTELDPNDVQRTALLRHAGAARFAYNWGLEQKIKALEARKAAIAAGVPKADAPKIPTYFDLHKQLVILKNVPVEQGGFPWMYECSKSAPQEALRNLDKAFQAFYRKCKDKGIKAKGFPQFKSRKKEVGGFRSVPPKVEMKHVTLPRIGRVRLKESRYIPQSGSRLLSSTVKEKAGKWFVSVAVEEAIEVSDVTGLPVFGVDVGVKILAALSDGRVFENPKVLDKSLKRLKLLQQSVSRKIKGSKNREKAKRRVSRQHYRISCVRNDALHKTSDSITKNCSVVVLEDLNVAGMMKNPKISRAVADASMAELHRQIQYKALWRGVAVVTASRWYPSSKTCSNCGKVKEILTLDDRVYDCDACGVKVDRDLNAAINLKSLAVSSTVEARKSLKARGEVVSHQGCVSNLDAASSKQESNTNLGRAQIGLV